MARSKRSATLDTRTKRHTLAAGKRHSEPLQRGGYLIYRRPESGAAGSWSARWVDPETKEQKQTRLGDADDLQDADGLSVLTFAQAQVKAAAWFRASAYEAALEAGAEVKAEGVYTVRDALRDYLADAKRRGMKGHLITTQSANAHILPPLGEVAVAKLTRRRIEGWLLALSETPRKTTGRPRNLDEDEVALPRSEEATRKRRVTANRVLSILKAALNHALTLRRVTEPAPWREVKPFKGVDTSRVRFLTIEEQQRLVEACDSTEFRVLVQAALFTGARYGDLTRLRVQDFNPQAGTLFLGMSKTNRPRHIFLTEEAVVWFGELTSGRAGSALMLQREAVARTTRKGVVSPDSWARYDQTYPMAKACAASGIEPLCFHELRHTYASGLVNRGVPLVYVAQQLGHTTTRMVEKVYGHLCPNAQAASIRAMAPELGIAPRAKVQALRVKQR